MQLKIGQKVRDKYTKKIGYIVKKGTDPFTYYNVQMGRGIGICEYHKGELEKIK